MTSGRYAAPQNPAMSAVMATIPSSVPSASTTGTRRASVHVRTDLNTWVAGVGSDSYVATVTPAEAWIGGPPLLVSLNEDGQALSQPRLIVDGDVKGGRYVSDMVDLAVGEGVLGP